jgi:lactoylglutathione lyase
MMKFGYTIIFVEDVINAVEFYERAFDIQRAVVTPNFAQMQTGEVSLAFGANQNERSELPIPFRENQVTQDPAGIQISFIAENVPQAFDRAISAGAISVVEPQQMPWGQTISRVRDCNGVLVSIVSEIPKRG